jgi:predicted metal-dependent enzyme (double-stranded beta helix superfamily)
MLALDFPGSNNLIEKLDAAVSQGSVEQITAALRRTLCELIQNRDVSLPDCCFSTLPDHYGRRELYRSEPHGYSVVAMTWAPGQGTPLHDHSGMWCVEGVWHGELEITQYEMSECKGDRCRFIRGEPIEAGRGSAGSLIPPHEYHTIRNLSEDSVAVSLHIYRGEMTCCTVFEPLGDGWYRRGTKDLALDYAA